MCESGSSDELFVFWSPNVSAVPPVFWKQEGRQFLRRAASVCSESRSLGQSAPGYSFLVELMSALDPNSVTPLKYHSLK